MVQVRWRVDGLCGILSTYRMVNHFKILEAEFRGGLAFE